MVAKSNKIFKSLAKCKAQEKEYAALVSEAEKNITENF